MADISFTASDVRPLPGYVAYPGGLDAGGTVYRGEAVYIDSDGDFQRADCDAGSLEAAAVGIFVAKNDGGTVITDGKHGDVVMSGPVTGYSSLTPGLHCFVSTNAGQMTQDTPAAGSYVVSVGVAISASTIFVNPQYATPYVVKS